MFWRLRSLLPLIRFTLRLPFTIFTLPFCVFAGWIAFVFAGSVADSIAVAVATSTNFCCALSTTPSFAFCSAFVAFLLPAYRIWIPIMPFCCGSCHVGLVCTTTRTARLHCDFATVLLDLVTFPCSPHWFLPDAVPFARLCAFLFFVSWAVLFVVVILLFVRCCCLFYRN